MTRPAGNRKLKAARLANGLASQEALAAALTAAAEELGLRGLGVGVRQVRRWESSDPPWPQPHHQRLLTHVLGLRVDELGFEPPWNAVGAETPTGVGPHAGTTSGRRPTRSASTRRVPESLAADIATVTVAHRRMYWITDPAHLHPAVVEHIRLGEPLLRQAASTIRVTLARALAESAMLAGRIEFFDLRRPDSAAETFVRAMQFAEDAGEQLLGAAILGHAAFLPGWEGDRDGAAERLLAARAYARRAAAPALFIAWLDAVEAECLTRCGDTAGALGVLARAESSLATADPGALPPWMDWFSAVRLAAFKGNAALMAGHVRRARDTLVAVLDALPASDVKQRSVVLADLAAVEVAAKDVRAACVRAEEALDALSEIWYATGMERIRRLRQTLRPWQNEQCVRDLDDRLYGWNSSLSVLTR